MGIEIPDLKMQEVGGAQLPYLYYEGGTSQIIFVHATGFMPWLWHPVISEFVPQNSAWAPFVCDYRECNPQAGGLSWEIISRDLAAFCNALQIENPLFVGHSMGATVSTIAVANYGIKARGLILIEPIFLPEEFYSMEVDIKKHPLASKSIKRANHWNDENAAWSYLKSKSLFASWDEQILQLYLKYGMQKQEEGNLKLTCSPQNEAAMFMGGWDVNPWPLLDKLTCPVLVVEGEKSENKRFVDVQRAVSLFRQGQYKSVEKAGHLIPMQKPRDIVRIIKDFIVKL
jgi:Predicted hydrolases or acyltransferases (alpha/beta hydrolase superfamily)